MNGNDEKRSIAQIKTGYFVFTGAVVGAVLGLVAYMKNWL